MKVLHVTSWYPNDVNPREALWIQRQIRALGHNVTDYFIIHLAVIPADRLRFTKGEIVHGIRRRLEVPLRSWFLIELLAGAMLAYYLWKLRAKRFDVINFHIGYPLLVYWHWLKLWFRVPAVISEHWSAYHFNFGIDLPRKLSRVRRIFSQNIPVIAVSRALAEDLKRFALAEFSTSIIPNVVDESTFFPDDSVARENFFFIASQWKWPKRPLVVFEAFREFVKVHADFKLKVAGFGPDYQGLASWIEVNQMQHAIILLGALRPDELASHYRSCRAFVHCSEYETFSVVCAEALTCGAPVLASKVGAIAEVVRHGEGILLDSMVPQDWQKAMNHLLQMPLPRADVNRYDSITVGKAYYRALCRATRSDEVMVGITEHQQRGPNRKDEIINGIGK